MLDAVKRLYRRTITIDDEQRQILRFVQNACASTRGARVLDVGCGYGRNLRALQRGGLDAVGVEINPDIVAANRAAGLRCMTVREFRDTRDKHDVVLMSHVIEHFSPGALVPFIDEYLARLPVGGQLVVATPLLSSDFYDDFDHVKPYQPIGLLMVFGEDAAQVQYYARNQLALRDLWFRRSPRRVSFTRARYIGSAATRLVQGAEFCSALLFRASGGLLGRTDGWVGRFEKVGERQRQQ